jgi:hypothetical protein
VTVSGQPARRHAERAKADADHERRARCAADQHEELGDHRRGDPGISGSFADVAGQLNQNIGNAYHGKTGTKRQFDGMSIDHASGNVGYLVNSAMVQEISLQSSGISAESNADGSVVNMIPKEGSNSLQGRCTACIPATRSSRRT